MPSTSCTITSLTRSPDEVNSRIRKVPAARAATANRPSQCPQAVPSRKAPPLVARVGLPDLHFASRASGNFTRSVIGVKMS